MTDVAALLKFANIQVASEAFLQRAKDDADLLSSALTDGNGHATRFPRVLADQFARDYTVVSHRDNTTTGFSGTLFRNTQTNELILSFRSTEFVDDSLRDAKATGDLEIARLGWAIGQISDMEAFYTELKASNKISPTDVFYVTGYSLGGHLATAFNLLRQEAGEAERIVHTYTFNGAGTGGLPGGAQLQTIVSDFRKWRKDPASIPWSNFTPSQREYIEREAASRVQQVLAEEARLKALSGTIPFNPGIESLTNLVSAKDLDYQIAVLAATYRRTTPSSGFPVLWRGENIFPTSPVFASSRIENMTEVVGADGGYLGPSFVANSGLHHGYRQGVYIEDQPLYRGTFDKRGLFRRELLQSGHPASGFGDTHSIVLLVDSLSVMDVFSRLATKEAGLTQTHIEQIFSASSRAHASATLGTQGKAEGDTLERSLDALRRLIVDPKALPTGTADDLVGGTWHATGARNRFHENVGELNKKIAESGLAGKLRFTITPDLNAMIAGAKLDGDEGAAWRYALVHLNPFVVHGDRTLLKQYAEEKYAKSGSTHPDGLTDAYIQDRAAFLAWKNEDFQANGKKTLRSTERATYEYVDKRADGNDLKLTVQGRMYSPAGKPIVDVVFGSDAAEVIAGDNVPAVDRLYGGGGDDVLAGGAGNDHLEGNAGADTLDGGTGADVLIAGSGDDTLRGGTEIDTYIVGAGNDHVIDEDGRGILMDTEGNRIGGLLVQQGSHYVLADNPEITATFGDSLDIVLANGAIVSVHDFDDGELGLYLQARDVEAPTVNQFDLSEGDDVHTVVSAFPAAVRGFGGNDFITVAYVPEDVLLEGGAGGDALSGGDENGRQFGGTEADLEALVSGGASGNMAPEALRGGRGDDLLVGGDSSDWLAGGEGNDEIYAGTGDDLIAGGGEIYLGPYWWRVSHPEVHAAPFMQDTLHFNVDIGPTSISVQTGVLLEENGRIARGEFLELRTLDDQDGADTIIAGAGNDEVWAGWGDDFVSGDGGADRLIGEEGADTLFGGEGDDVIEGDGTIIFGGPDNHGADYIDGGTGNDEICGGGADDTIFGGAGDDVLAGDDEALDVAYHGSDYLDGEEGDDLIAGHGGDDRLFGGDGTDELQGGSGDDYLDGEAGADTAFGGEGGDALYGGSGEDRLLGEGGDDYISGDDEADILFGDDGDDTLAGGDGADALYGEADADGLYGGKGNDFLNGGEGDDVLSGGAGADMLVGGAGNDVYSFAAGDGADTLIDNEGANTIRFTGAWSPATLKIVQSGADGGFRIQHGYDGDAIVLSSDLAESVQHFEFADGSVKTLREVLDLAEADPIVLSGARFGASLYGGSNNDTLTVGEFSRADGGRGDDTLTSTGDYATFEFAAGDGHDRVRGGGNVTFEFDESVSRSDLIAFRTDPLDPAAVTPRDLILQYGSPDNPDTIVVADDARSASRRYQFADGSLSHVELLERSGLSLQWLGSGDDETVAGTRNADRLAGEAGRDTLDGQSGDDILDGGAAADVLRGGDGNDTLIGRTGNDTLEGGAGDDRYAARHGDGIDVVVDNAGSNVIEFEGVSMSDIDADLVSGDDGNLYLAVRYSPSDAVLVRQNFGDTAGDGTLTFRFSDGVQLTTTELASREFAGPLDLRGANEALRISGSAFDDVVIGSTRDDRIEGGAGDDRLAGDAGRDVLSGGNGADFLVGNSGDDVLDGGAGRDVYRFHRGMGKDLVIEVSGEQSVLHVDAGIERADLTCERSGDDLYVHIANSRDGVHIRNYFGPAAVGVQSWQVQFGDEPATTLASLVGEIETEVPPATVEAQMADFSLRVRIHYESLLIADGYRRQGDGTLLKDELASDDYYSSHAVTTVGFEYRNGFDDSAWINGNTIPFELLHSQASSTYTAHTFQQLDTTGATYVPMGAGRNMSSGRVVTFAGDPDDISMSNDQDTSVFIPAALLETSPFSGVRMPNASGGGSYSFRAATPRYTTQTVIRSDLQAVYDYRVTLDTLRTGNSDNEISAGPLSVIDAGGGDDRITVDGEILLPGYRVADGAGAPGAFLFGNAGNDTMSGGSGDDVLIGGRDNDILFGGAGNDLYVLHHGDGSDEIIESGATVPGIARENVLRLPDGVTLGNIQQTLTHELAARRQSAEPAIPDPIKSLHAFLTLTWGNTDGVRLAIPHADQGAAHGIDYVEFSDGSRIALTDLVARIGGELDRYSAENVLAGNGLIDGGPGDDVVQSDRPIGGAGRDTLIGTDGDDELFGGTFHKRVLTSSARFSGMWDEGNIYRGGAGDDQIWASAGADTFEFELGDGCDTITDVQHDSLYLSYGGTLDRLVPWLDAAANEPAHRAALYSNTDTIAFGTGIAPEDIDIMRSGSVWDAEGDSDALIVRHRNGADAIRFANWYQRDYQGQPLHNQLARVTFADGTSWDRQTIEALAAGAPRLIGQSDSDDFMQGTRFDELLVGGEGNDWLQGGRGNDVLDGGAGDDVYFFEPGDGVDVVKESGVGTFDVLQFGGSITADDLSLGLGSLLIRLEGTADAIHIEGFDPADALSSGTIERFDFSDGTSLTFSELLARGFDLEGSAIADVLTGTDVSDRMRGFSGNDRLSGEAGDDRLDGGEGDDVLDGGAGNDTYYFGAGYGADRIIDSAGALDSLRLGAGIDSGDVRVIRSGDTLTLSFAGLTDTVSLSHAGRPAIEEVVFADGAVWDASALESKVEAETIAPVLLTPIADRSVAEDTLFTFRVPDGTFSTSGATLTFSALLGDGTTLPEWLVFDPATRTLSGTPGNEDVGELDVTVTASAGNAGFASDSFRISIDNTNDRPQVERAIADQWAQEDFPFTLAVPTDTFTDVDAGDVTTLGATLADGSALPVWLRFDPTTRTLNGQPANGDVGSLRVRITATDLVGEQAAIEFTLNVVDVNDNPVLRNALPDLRTVERQAFDFNLPAQTFADFDVGDALHYEATLAGGTPLPAWLTFDPETGAFSGTPGEEDIGVYRVSLAAYDTSGSSASDDFDLEVVPLPGRNVMGTARADELTGSPGADLMHGFAGNDKLFGHAGRDVIFGGAGNDRADGGSGDDWLFGGIGNDALAGEAGRDMVWGGDGNDALAGGAGDDHLHGQTGNDKLLGGAGQDYLDGGHGNDELSGEAGEGFLRGDAGNDTLTGSAANDLLDAGSGNDTLDAGDGEDFIAGGTGADVVKPGSGRDIIAFNRGDGADTLHGAGSAEDTLSLGGAIRYADLTFTKSGHDLVLHVGFGDRIALKDWYAGQPARSVAKLQVFTESMPESNSRNPDPLLGGGAVQTFDFQRLAAAFDAARAANPKLSSWSIAPELPATRIGRSDTMALGGALAHEYATRGSFDDVDPRAALDALVHPAFGRESQAFAGQTTDPNGPEVPDVDGPDHPRPCGDDSVRRLAADWRDGALDDWAGKLEEAVERWLERSRRDDDGLFANNDEGKNSRVEPDLEAAWRRTRALLELHLRPDRASTEFDGAGAVFMSQLDGAGVGVYQHNTLGRVSGHHLQTLNGLEEGFKALAA